MSSIAYRIRKLRKARKLTQEAFAKSLGVNQGHISKIETGLANPSKQLIKLIGREYKVREEWLLEGKTILDQEGLKDKEIEDFELNVENISKQGLKNILNGYAMIIENMVNSLDKFVFVYHEIGKPDNELLAEKQNIEDALDYLKSELSSFFKNLEKQDKGDHALTLEAMYKSLSNGNEKRKK